MFSIGEFSKITGLTVKTLRFYHEQGVLVPSRVDGQSGYRYYADNKVETARIIVRLRALEFPLHDITQILNAHEDDGDILDYLERQKRSLQEKMKQYREMDQSLEQIINQEMEARRTMTDQTFDIVEKRVDPLLVAGIRMKGAYSDCGKGFSTIGKRFGRHLCGKPLLLHFDDEYKEDDAEFEACIPVRKGGTKDGVTVHEIPGGECVALLHKGPYDDIGRSYAKIFEYVNERGYKYEVPTRELYLKGPGMLFKGNPKNYLTEIQLLIKERS